jgi:hypothetical protein
MVRHDEHACAHSSPGQRRFHEDGIPVLEEARRRTLISPVSIIPTTDLVPHGEPRKSVRDFRDNNHPWPSNSDSLALGFHQ